MWEIVYYKTNSGRIPVLDYIELQEALKIVKIRNAFRLLKEFGVEESLLDTKKIKGNRYKGLCQLTIESSRIIYFIVRSNKFVLAHAFTKKTNKTPKQELETARKRMKDYLNA
ncbi:type II toxin-antitoxin system RelE/ParE family toxin [bacterium]|nr:type II toxin-antitoxin system RelE/ParE family toxin [bacterium]